MTYCNDTYVTPPVIELHWAGWTSDTFKLQRAGWNFSARQDPINDMLEFMLRHKQYKMYGQSYATGFHQYYSENSMMGNSFRHIDIALASDFIMYGMNERDFAPIDVTPKPYFLDLKPTRMSDLKIFKELNVDAQQILLNKASMSEILNVALSRQAPMQDEIRERMIKDKRLLKAGIQPRGKVEAELRLVA